MTHHLDYTTKGLDEWAENFAQAYDHKAVIAWAKRVQMLLYEAGYPDSLVCFNWDLESEIPWHARRDWRVVSFLGERPHPIAGTEARIWPTAPFQGVSWDLKESHFAGTPPRGTTGITEVGRSPATLIP